MPIRSIDLQTLIPKMPEVQKVKSVEAETPGNNINISIHKDQEQMEKNLKQVNKKERPSDIRINNDREKKKQGQDEKDKEEKNGDAPQDGKEKGRDAKPKTRIDIRI